MKITYTDKESLVTSPLPSENKVTDSDMNEIKNVVNSNDDDIIALQNKTTNFQTYYTAWGTSITFNLPIGRHAILMRSQNTFYTVWNTNSAIEWAIVFGSGVSITRDSSDNTKITATKTDDATWTVVVF